jgi:hypothetical protein
VQLGDRVFLGHTDVDKVAVGAEKGDEVVEGQIGGVYASVSTIPLTPTFLVLVLIPEEENTH